jgi:hypothetical protein
MVVQVIVPAVILHKSLSISLNCHTVILLAVTAQASILAVVIAQESICVAVIELACISFPVIVFAAILSAVMNVLCELVPKAWNDAFFQLSVGAATHNKILLSHTALEALVVA